jgi:3'(2'), 5'-bisphosphate nucleotidase
MNFSPHLELAAALATRAAQTIMTIRERGFTTECKPDDSPVTEADRAAEAIILEGLRQAWPEIQAVAEEEVSAGHRPQVGSTYWLIDPLDGTREFIRMRREFTVNIGLIHEGQPVMGVVAVPAFGEMFGGVIGGPVWKRDVSGERAISVRQKPAQGMTVLASPHGKNDTRLDDFLQDYPVDQIVKYGSSLKFVRLAEGVGDLYPRFDRTMEWDTAAPQAILEAAGGQILTMRERTRLGYGKLRWENPSLLCVGG